MKFGIREKKESNMGMDFNQIALEYTKLYFTCHPEKLPEDELEALHKMQEVHGLYKNKIIVKQTKKNEDFFRDI